MNLRQAAEAIVEWCKTTNPFNCSFELEKAILELQQALNTDPFRDIPIPPTEKELGTEWRRTGDLRCAADGEPFWHGGMLYPGGGSACPVWILRRREREETLEDKLVKVIGKSVQPRDCLVILEPVKQAFRDAGWREPVHLVKDIPESEKPYHGPAPQPPQKEPGQTRCDTVAIHPKTGLSSRCDYPSGHDGLHSWGKTPSRPSARKRPV